MVSMTFIWWIYHFWARFWPYFNFVDFRAYFGPFSLVNRDRQKMADLLMKMASNQKMQENKPTLKFNFTIEKRWPVSIFELFGPQHLSHWALLHRIFFFSWPYPRHVFQCLGYEILSGMGFQINWYYMAFLQLSSWSRCIFYFISLTSTVSSGRVLRRGRPGSTVLTGVRRAAVNRIVPLALVHNLYTPLVTACQGFILFWCYQ